VHFSRLIRFNRIPPRSAQLLAEEKNLTISPTSLIAESSLGRPPALGDNFALLACVLSRAHEGAWLFTSWLSQLTRILFTSKCTLVTIHRTVTNRHLPSKQAVLGIEMLALGTSHLALLVQQ
jgi:hypothetical protein